MSITVEDGALVTKDPAAVLVYTFDWDARNLPAGVTIASQTVTVSAVRPSTTDATLIASVASPLGILAGSRKVGVSLAAGTLGQMYAVTNRIVTNETPAQTKERSFRVLIENQ